MRQFTLGSCVAVGLFALSSVSLVAQNADAEDQAQGIQIIVSDAVAQADGSLGVASGTHAVSLLAPSGDFYAGLFVWTAQTLGEFELVPHGLLFHGALNTDGSLRMPVNVPPELVGSLVTARAFSTPDGRLINGSPVYNFRIL